MEVASKLVARNLLAEEPAASCVTSGSAGAVLATFALRVGRANLWESCGTQASHLHHPPAASAGSIEFQSASINTICIRNSRVAHTLRATSATLEQPTDVFALASAGSRPKRWAPLADCEAQLD